MDNPCLRHGAFSWCELLTNDVEAAKNFYGKLFDWTLEPSPNAVPGVDYTLVKCAGQPIAGIMAIPADKAGMPPHWGSYVTVDDVDATAKLAEAMGGKVCLPPQDVPEVGRFCILQDPQGAVLSIVSYLPQMTCGT